MKLSFQALKRFVDFSGNASEAAESLASLGFPNDGVVHRGGGLSQAVLGKILKKSKHPEADKLSLLEVDVGTEVLPIVCGASNMKEQDLVAVAKVGAVLPGDFKIKEAKIRGQISKGMCCSESELGLKDKSEGIWILNDRILDPKLGMKISELASDEDWILEVDVTPNRGDALNVRGLARELSALLGTKIRNQPSMKVKFSGSVRPSIENLEDTFGFLACTVNGLKAGPTPPNWIQFLENSGGRSLFNLVDVSNIVLFELGHPVHFFDAEKIDVASLTARRARAGEKLKLLNETEIELSPEDIVIADRDRVLSLAGIMGGVGSGVSESTKSIVIEVACFDPKRIRASAKRHGLSTEASQRFERGISPLGLEEVLERSLGLLKELSGFESFSASKGPEKKWAQNEVIWSRPNLEKKLGKLSISDDEIFQKLRLLEYVFEVRGSTTTVKFPWYRTDCFAFEDLCEDVGRVIGYENLEVPALKVEISAWEEDSRQAQILVQERLVDRAIELGFTEVLSMSFISPDVEDQWGLLKEKQILLQNPIHSEKSALRQRLLPGLCDKAAFNLKHHEQDVWLVEAGPVYDRALKDQVESIHLACVWAPRPGDRKHLWESNAENFFVFKGRVEALWQGFRGAPWTPAEPLSFLHPRRQVKMKNGYWGQIHPLLAQDLDLPPDTLIGEWRVQGSLEQVRYSRPPEFPMIDLDAALLVDEKITSEELIQLMKSAKEPTLESLEVYDAFQSDRLPKGKKSLAFAMRYRSRERTLSLEEAKEAHQRMLEKVFKAFSGDRVALR